MKMYKVYATVWSDEFKSQIKKCMGIFDSFVNAKLFSDAYANRYSSKTIIEEDR